MSSPSNQPDLPSPFLVAKRALDYWHKHGQFPFQVTGYDPRTGLVAESTEHRRSRAQSHPHPHQRTATQSHMSTVTLTHRAPDVMETVILKEQATVSVSESDEGTDTTSSRTPSWMQPLVRSEREDRESAGITAKDYGTRWQSAYRVEIGNSPECGGGDREAARQFWSRIVAAIEKGGWTPAENNRLHLLERKWRKRKDGEDPRFEVIGTWRGNVTEEDRKRIEDWKLVLGLTR